MNGIEKIIIRNLDPQEIFIHLLNHFNLLQVNSVSSFISLKLFFPFLTKDSKYGIGGAVFGTLLLIYLLNDKYNKAEAQDKKDEKEDEVEFQYIVSPENEKLPHYTRDEVSKHKTKETGIWVTYGNYVYDITEFSEEHPGGEKILMAAGGAIDPYWSIYAVHKHENVLEILERLRIGVLAPADRVDPKNIKEFLDANDPYSGDPIRNPILQVNSAKPFNAESPTQLLVETFLTPNELFFIRNHLPVPKLKPEEYILSIHADGLPPIVLTLDDLKTKFPQHTIVSTIQCAGNRRSEMSSPQKPVKGLAWKQGAIGNAEWTGVKLFDVLKYAGIDVHNPKFQHIQFEGYDKDPTGQTYGASIPIHKVSDPSNDVVLAFQMNGKTIDYDHGYPVRLIVPGVVAARSVKWLAKIIASDKESSSFWQQSDYKGFSPSVDWNNVDFKSAPAIQELPVQSAICEPTNGTTLKNVDEVQIKGYAYSGGGRGIVRVDVTIDGGKNWHVATLKNPTLQPLHRSWAWTLWEVTLPVPKNSPRLFIQCKAVDSSYNVQPDNVEPIWNLRGVLNNAWHKIEVNLD